MLLSWTERLGRRLLARAGIRVNGDQPWDISVHDRRFYRRVLAHGALGLGESYMDGLWDCDRLDLLVCRLLRSGLHRHGQRDPWFFLYRLVSPLINHQSRHRSRTVGRRHYDIDPELYRLMLDREMIYSCGYWARARDLDTAQTDKLELIARKLELRPGMRLLDIGCGWGGLLRHAHLTRGVEGVGITISRRQAELARQRCHGLPIRILCQDYRDIQGQFDRAVSVGMFEHVGPGNYAAYMRIVHDHLVDDGRFLLHTIGVTGNRPGIDPWVIRYIFPNAVLPTAASICNTACPPFLLADWHNLGDDYIKTLAAWHHNFNQHWETLSSRHDERFRRMWNYFLLYFMGGFRARHIQPWQIVLSKQSAPAPCSRHWR